MSVAKSRPVADISTLPAQEISTEVLVEKYAKDGETTIREVRARVAKALAQNEAEDRRAGPLWFLLRELDPRGLRRQPVRVVHRHQHGR